MENPSPTTNPKICGAANRAGEPCKRAPMKNGRCSKHGGMTPVGVASPHFKHGKYSKYLPQRLKTTFDEAIKQESGTMLDHSAEVALYNSRLVELISALDTETASEQVLKIRRLWQEFNRLNRAAATSRANQEKLGPRLAVLVLELDDAIERAAEDWMIWKDVDAVVNQSVKLGKYEMERLEKAHRMVATEHVLGLFTELMQLVREHVSDESALRAIQRGMTDLIGE
jgi:hypothetical protein